MCALLFGCGDGERSGFVVDEVDKDESHEVRTGHADCGGSVSEFLSTRLGYLDPQQFGFFFGFGGHKLLLLGLGEEVDKHLGDFLGADVIVVPIDGGQMVSLPARAELHEFALHGTEGFVAVIKEVFAHVVQPLIVLDCDCKFPRSVVPVAVVGLRIDYAHS